MPQILNQGSKQITNREVSVLQILYLQSQVLSVHLLGTVSYGWLLKDMSNISK